MLLQEADERDGSEFERHAQREHAARAVRARRAELFPPQRTERVLARGILARVETLEKTRSSTPAVAAAPAAPAAPSRASGASREAAEAEAAAAAANAEDAEADAAEAEAAKEEGEVRSLSHAQLVLASAQGKEKGPVGRMEETAQIFSHAFAPARSTKWKRQDRD